MHKARRAKSGSDVNAGSTDIRRRVDSGSTRTRRQATPQPTDVPPVGRGLLLELGAKIRTIRHEKALSRRGLAAMTGLSERFLAQVEGGEGNPSILSLSQIAAALGTSAAALLTARSGAGRFVLALLGLRGAGKSTIGRAIAARIGAEFIELDARVEEAAGLTLREIFELHGEDYYRRLEREALDAAFAPAREPIAAAASGRQVRHRRAARRWPPSYRIVLATGGGIVTHAESFERLKLGATTVWLRATPEEHWERVVAQGDHRPMANDPLAMAHLKELLSKREVLYREADHVVETSGLAAPVIVDRVLAAVASSSVRHTA